jgi:transcriptional regulator with XRE-family HTH domain
MAGEKLLKDVGENIRQLRLSKGFGQTKVATDLGISVAALSKIENGLTDINISRLAQIAKLFQVSMLELISKDINMAPSNLLAEMESLKHTVGEKEQEIFKLQKKVIDLYEKLGM